VAAGDPALGRLCDDLERALHHGRLCARHENAADQLRCAQLPLRPRLAGRRAHPWREREPGAITKDSIAWASASCDISRGYPRRGNQARLALRCFSIQPYGGTSDATAPVATCASVRLPSTRPARTNTVLDPRPRDFYPGARATSCRRPRSALTLTSTRIGRSQADHRLGVDQRWLRSRSRPSRITSKPKRNSRS
jgi:hypothetical protein